MAKAISSITLACVVAVAANLLVNTANADERLKGIACRSVHLQYPADEAVEFYNEITVRQSAPGTYFCVCGFNKGYFGLQELANGKKLLIFSVWDPGNQNDPNAVEDELRVELLHQGEGVRIGRFGNEGTGGQSFYDFDWQQDQAYRFMVRAEVLNEKRTAYQGWFFHPERKQWLHLVTFSTIANGDKLKGYYSFVEDFRRNRISATQTRTAEFGNGWIRTKAESFQPLKKARFTGDGNPVVNIDAVANDKSFSLSTGGDIQNQGTPLWESMEYTSDKPPTDLPK